MAGAGAADVNRLVEDHIDLVQHVVNQVAMRYPRHVDRDELWNAGALGLVEAARRFRPDTGVPFARYAQVRIRGAIIDSTRDRDWAGRALRRDMRSIREAEEELAIELGTTPSDDLLAERLGMSLETLRARRSASVTAAVLHLDHAGPEQDPLTDMVVESDPGILPEDSLEERELVGTLRTAIKHLPEPQREVIERYYLGGEPIQAIAESMNVTQARISQISSEAVNALRTYLGELYEGVPEVAPDAPGKRKRASYLGLVATATTWRERLAAADQPSVGMVTL